MGFFDNIPVLNGSADNFLSGLPVVGGMFESDEEKALKEQYAQMQKKYAAYRPVAQQARMAGLQNVLDPRMLGPIQQQLAKMYGGGAAFDPSVLMRNPLTAAQQNNAPQRPPPGTMVGPQGTVMRSKLFGNVGGR